MMVQNSPDNYGIIKLLIKYYTREQKQKETKN